MRMDRRELIKKSAMAMGITLTAPSLTAILNSCSGSAPLGWTPKVFSDDQARTIAGVVDTILPKTDTPGALELMVDRFVDTMIDVGYSNEDKASFLEELSSFMTSCEDAYGNSFENCSPEEKNDILSEQEKSKKFVRTVWGQNVRGQEPVTFYRKLKGLIMLGYYTSEEVGKNIFSYDPVPGKQIGCVPLSEVGNSWTEG